MVFRHSRLDGRRQSWRRCSSCCPPEAGETLTMVLRPAAESTAVLAPCAPLSGPQRLRTSGRDVLPDSGPVLGSVSDEHGPGYARTRKLLLPLLAVALRTLQQIAIRYQGDNLPHAGPVRPGRSDWMVDSVRPGHGALPGAPAPARASGGPSGSSPPSAWGACLPSPPSRHSRTTHGPAPFVGAAARSVPEGQTWWA